MKAIPPVEPVSISASDANTLDQTGGRLRTNVESKRIGLRTGSYKPGCWKGMGHFEVRIRVDLCIMRL